MSATRSIPAKTCIDGVTFEMFLERVDGHPRCNILYDPSHFVLQQLDYLGFIDIYHERIRMFHVKDAEFNPTGKQGVYGGYQPWVEPRRPLPLARRRPGRLQGDLLQARAVRLRRLGGARMGVLPQASRGRRARRRAVHPPTTSSASPRRRSTISPAAAPTGAANRRMLGTGAMSGSEAWSTKPDARKRRLRLGMVGGGRGAFIGAVHRIAARLDDQYELVAGALSVRPGAGAASRPPISASRPSASTPTSRTWPRAEAERAGRHRRGRDRHAEPHAHPDRDAPSSKPAST